MKVRIHNSLYIGFFYERAQYLFSYLSSAERDFLNPVI